MASIDLRNVSRCQVAEKGIIFLFCAAFRSGVYPLKANSETEAIEWAGEKAAERLKGCLDKDNQNGLQTFLHQWRERLHRSNFQQGCPIVAAAIEASQDEHEEQIKLAISRIFKRWQSILADHFISHGRTVVFSNSMALTVISCLEGAVILSRGYQTIEPFDAIIDTLSLLVDQGKEDSE